MPTDQKSMNGKRNRNQNRKVKIPKASKKMQIRGKEITMQKRKPKIHKALKRM